jgi:type I restriction enzyme S subunit
MTRVATFAELVSMATLEIGDGYRAKNQELGGNGLIFLRAAYLQDAGFRMDQPDRFLTNVISNFGPKIAQVGDVVITTKGNSTGRVGRIREPQAGSVYSPHLSYWRSKRQDEIDQNFLFYWSQSPEFRSQLAGMASSTDMAPYLSLRDQLRLRISLPQIEDQRAIGSILAALDDKIDLNRRTNETLEAMARAIFKDWFVDFGPTRAKMHGTAPYLAPEIWSVFPDQLDGEGKPEGWAKEQLLKHAHLLSGGTPKTAEPAYWGGPIQWASAKDVSQCGELFLLETERSITERGLEESSTRIIPSLSTVVVARGATTGRFCMFGSEMAMNQTCYALSTKISRPFWINCIFASLVASIVHAAHGSVFDTITTRTIEGAVTIVPCDALLDEFENVVGPLFLKILKNTEASRTLAATRDLLLPKLMSGEIRLKDAEKIAEAAQ